ncbi:MAG TPA: tellurite resistance/C4-dicarboxylate transporter family protein [Phycisphaerae bacterium]|nr:tellurite resistance/C4-dicarboxylate transporter family protein [Phycisphaerae bacterium]HRW52890.1 tellurite resistance/C4-dicarboxylate transporter family protein [Phycisphaerae bacterium]
MDSVGPVETTAPSRASEMSSRWAGIETLHPAYFALVMATGIVSIASQLLGMTRVAFVLFVLNIVFYVTLWGLTGLRVVWFARQMVSDLTDHGRSVGFFTMVAGTCVFGSQCFIIASRPMLAAALWVLGIALWIFFTYAIFTSLTVKGEKPSLAQGINGGWLVAVVATQSVSILGTQLAPFFGPHHEGILFFTLSMWLGGGMLYIWIISLIFYRYTFFVLEPSDLSPPYWINMGAMAISTLAGAMLISAAPESALLRQILPFLKGFTLFFWATATWWIPMLLILGVWRHGYKRFSLRYDPLYWGAVFPLGMYTACTLRVSQAMDIEFITSIPNVFIWIALAAWSLTFVGLIRRIMTLLAARAA